MPANLEVADVFRRHGDAYRRAHAGHLNRLKRRVMSAIELCRTAALGGHTEVCSDCGLIHSDRPSSNPSIDAPLRRSKRRRLTIGSSNCESRPKWIRAKNSVCPH